MAIATEIITPTQRLRSAVHSLVVRAREGDENAMAMIASVRESAAKGSARAKQSLEAITAYINANPVKQEETDIGAEAEMGLSILNDVGPIIGLPILLDLAHLGGDDALFAASIILANQKRLVSDRISEIADGFHDSESHERFIYAVQNSHRNIGDESLALPLEAKKAFYAGLCIGLAQNIQRVRLPKSDIARFSPMAAWEMTSL